MDGDASLALNILCLFGLMFVGMLAFFAALVAIAAFAFTRFQRQLREAQEAWRYDLDSRMARSPFLEARAPYLIPWGQQGLRQVQSLVVYDQGYREPVRLRYRGRVMARPATTPQGPMWMAFDMDVRWKQGVLLACTERYHVALELLRYGWGELGEFQVWVDNKALGMFRYTGKELRWLDPQGAVIGRTALRTLHIRVRKGPIIRFYDFRAYYVPITWRGEPLGEINQRPILWLQAQVQRRSERIEIPPLFRNLPASLEREPEMWLTALVLYLCYFWMLQYLRDEAHVLYKR